jgi:hypothetical protein
MRCGLFVLLSLSTAGCVTNEPPTAQLGAYRLDDGRTVSIRRSIDSTLRYRIFEDGSSGRLYPDSGNAYVSGPGFSDRTPADVTVSFQPAEDGVSSTFGWAEPNSAKQTARRIGTELDIRFSSHDTRLFGKLQLPEGPPPYPAVVLVHGSGDSVATE